ncbi:MAG TPA: hypothetical protein EYG86_01440 [Crocinitomicaceae bacterium]|nr:hypothetical protein [Crocinitomicaceae bacterium]
MKKRDFNKKKMVVSRGEYDMLRDMMTDEAFFCTFTVCNKLVTTMLAEEAMAHVAFTDILPVNNKTKLN